MSDPLSRLQRDVDRFVSLGSGHRGVGELDFLAKVAEEITDPAPRTERIDAVVAGAINRLWNSVHDRAENERARLLCGLDPATRGKDAEARQDAAIAHEPALQVSLRGYQNGQYKRFRNRIALEIGEMYRAKETVPPWTPLPPSDAAGDARPETTRSEAPDGRAFRLMNALDRPLPLGIVGSLAVLAGLALLAAV